MNSLIYLASPYTHTDPAVRQARFEAAVRAAAFLMKDTGLPVFCPIAHSHYIDLTFGTPESGEFWKTQDAPYLEAATELVVLQIEGWRTSAGVDHEMQVARNRGIPITYLTEHQTTKSDSLKETVPTVHSKVVSLHATPLPTDAQARKGVPVFSGLIKYFPDALASVAECSKKGNDQHNPGQPLHWDRSKSTDELDALSRHLFDAGTVDTDGIRHSTKVAWRALANLQKEIERERTQVAA